MSTVHPETTSGTCCDSPLIEIVLARVNAGRPDVQTYHIKQGTTAAAFLRQQSLVVESQPLPVMGVFSRKIVQPEQYVLQQGDRLELYQALILSPMDVRRARARAHPVGRLMRRRF
jgi:putative ubiquitin-RnfH superfamily antitoxin RatB of RatAB toxin-antitoxin module